VARIESIEVPPATGLSGQRWRIDGIAHAADGANQLRVELLAQVVDVHIQHVALDVAVPAVQGLFELGAAQHLPRTLEQLTQEDEFAPLQWHELPRQRDREADLVEHHLTMAQEIARRAALAPPQRSHAGEQFAHVERLHEIVIGPGIEAGHALFRRIARRQHENRCCVTTVARPANDFDAVEPRQIEIEHHHVEAAAPNRGEPLHAVAQPLDGVMIAQQGVAYALAQQFIVFDQQNAQEGGSRYRFTREHTRGCRRFHGTRAIRSQAGSRQRASSISPSSL
jgi:hypothetical protein